MRRWIVGIFVVMVSSVGVAQPKITVDRAKIDLGTIYNGTIKKARVTIKNIGHDTLQVLGVTTSCGCTTVHQPKSFLKTGESDVVEIEFNSTGYRGQIEKHINILTNDPTTPTAYVTLIGDVIEELQPVGSGSVVWFGTVPVNKQVDQSVAFKNISGKVLTVTGFTSSSPDLYIVFGNKKVYPADTIRFTIKVTPRKADYINEQLLLRTDSDKQPEVPVRVTLIGVQPN
ncbi:MAG TPA: DUF1573 domain-containing protein [Bacteroidota bacterium]|nr:DUF1573 domain-containing protein [Bacteroidota bacterium]